MFVSGDALARAKTPIYSRIEGENTTFENFISINTYVIIKECKYDHVEYTSESRLCDFMVGSVFVCLFYLTVAANLLPTRSKSAT